MKSQITNKIRKIILAIFLLILVIFVKTEVFAKEGDVATYGKDYFEEEYSNGYIRNCSYTNVIRTSSGVKLNSNFYTGNNTSKSEYIDYSKAARYINSDGEPIWLDMRVYIWTNKASSSWQLYKTWFGVENHSGSQHTTMEFHFYTPGYCGDENYEQSFNGITCLADIDYCEGFLVYSGYNKFYFRAGTPIIYISKGSKNSSNGNNPFSTSGIAEYPYFFGTRDNSNIDKCWLEINSTPTEPFKIVYGTRSSWFGAPMYYTGTNIEYYVDGVLKDTAYCVSYGNYRLINTSKFEAQKYGYNIDGWYTDSNYTKKAYNGIIGETTLRLYGRYIKYTITVDNDKNGHTYNSYQVFKGNYYEKEDENGSKKPILSNIEWSLEFQKEIATDNEGEQSKTHGDKILEILKETNSKLYTDCETAEDIAKALQGMPNDGEVIREFTDIVGKYILDNNIPITKGTSTLLEEKDKGGNVISNYKIKDLEPGYYIVIDAKANEKDDAYSRYLIDVVQDVTMEPKSSIPKLKKKVIGNNVKTKIDGTYVEDEKRNTATYKMPSENYNAEDYDIEFELKSYIPNPDGYSTYKFEIVDILAKGFDYDKNSIKVMLGENEYPKTRINKVSETVENYIIKDIKIDEKNYAEYKNYFEEEGKEYLDGYAESQYGKTLILIEISGLVEQLNDGIIEKGQYIILTYNAKLNGKGEVGNTPNINEAYLKYSNDPYHNDKITQTTTQTTYTYTIDLDLSKIAELKNEDSEKIYLSEAEFEIYNEPNTVESRTPIARITTDEMGQAFYSSLGAGTYYLKETKSPEGYNKLREEIEIEVIATCDEFGTITWNVEEKTNNNLLFVHVAEKEGTTIPEIKLQIENASGFQLPVTDGNGTIIYTIIGLSIITIVITYKIKQKKKFTICNK